MTDRTKFVQHLPCIFGGCESKPGIPCVSRCWLHIGSRSVTGALN